MFLRGIRRGSRELKVIAVLLYAFGLSLRKTPGFFWLLSEPLSKSSVQDWMKKVEAKLSFEPVQSWQRAIAVDESVVKCGGPTAVGVGCCRRVHEATHLSGWVFPPLTK